MDAAKEARKNGSNALVPSARLTAAVHSHRGEGAAGGEILFVVL